MQALDPPVAVVCGELEEGEVLAEIVQGLGSLLLLGYAGFVRALKILGGGSTPSGS